MSFIQDNIIIIKDIFSFVVRNAVWFIIGLVGLWLLKFDFAILQTIFQVLVFEALALALSGVALFAYTKFDFIQLLMYGKDGIANSVEQSNILRLLGNIFIGVHLIVGLIVLGTYLGNMSAIPN